MAPSALFVLSAPADARRKRVASESSSARRKGKGGLLSFDLVAVSQDPPYLAVTNSASSRFLELLKVAWWISTIFFSGAVLVDLCRYRP